MKIKKIVPVVLSLVFLSAACGIFGKTAPSGVVKTVNGGADWQFSNAIKDNKNGSLGTLNVSKLLLDPQNRETAYVGGYNGGLYKSEDSGGSWRGILSKIFVYDFVIHPADSKTIYVAGFYADHGKVLKTSDGGATWNEIYNEASTQNAVRSIALNTVSPNQIIIGMTSGNIVKSSDGGMSWKLSNNLNDRVNRIMWQNNTIYVLLRTKGLMKSADFGDNFQSLTDTLSQNFGSNPFGNTSGTVDVFNQFFPDPLSSSLIYVTTSRGLYKTTDEGKNWAHIALPVKSGESEARAIAIARSSSNIVFTNVGATIYKSLDGGETFQTQEIATTGFINYILIDPQLPQIAYAGIYSNQ